jgi:hypothetical protein
MIARRPGPLLVVIAALGYADLVFVDLVDESVLVVDAP